MGQNRPMRKGRLFFLVAATAAGLGALAALGGAAVVWGGLYDVSATAQHWQPTHTLLETAMRQSVRLRARGIAEPPLSDEALQLRGAGCYRDRCMQCHGGPGAAPDDIGKGMQPVPGPLVHAARQWRPRELYWLTRNGIRMSGMPAWEFRLADEELWALVAFMQRLPEQNAQQYADWLRRAPAPPACGAATDAALAEAPADAARGRRALYQYACNACHIIPGVTGSRVHVGPPLEGIGSRRLIAGVLPRNPETMALWLMRTHQAKPGTAMPAMGVAPQDARDMAAYLETLR